MVTYRVKPSDLPVRLRRLLQRPPFALPLPEIERLLRKRQIRLNDRRISTGDMALKTGDEIVVFMREQTFHEEPPPIQLRPITFRVLYEDDAMLVADKPPNLPVHDEKGEDNLDDQVKTYAITVLGIDQNDYLPRHVHRIDAETSGIVFYAKTPGAAAGLSEAIRDHDRFTKLYKARLHGRVDSTLSSIGGWISKDPTHPNRMLVKATDHPGAQECMTYVKVVKYDPVSDTTLVEFTLATGRKHQLRASAAMIKHPIVGDRRYGSKAGGNLKLVAYAVRFGEQTFYSRMPAV